jgi:Fe-S-cluster containining protein
MSLCDNCYSPGACCKGITLAGATGEFTLWDDDFAAAHKVLKEHSLPFELAGKVATYLDEDSGRTYSSVKYNCPLVTAEGRCGDYENRPDLCRRYEPASDGLCVHFRGAEGVDLVDGL